LRGGSEHGQGDVEGWKRGRTEMPRVSVAGEYAHGRVGVRRFR
jgi:hypothetical protein